MNRGDVGAFEALYLRHRDYVYRISVRFCGDSSDAQDATQDVFVYFLGKFPGFRLRGRLTTFLYPVARNSALTIKRKRRRLKFGGILPPEAIELHASLPIEDRTEELRGLDEAVRNLSAERSEIVLMRFVDGMEPADIARALGIPLGTAKSRLHRAIEELRGDPRFRRCCGIDEE